MSETLVPFRHVPSLFVGQPARLPLVEFRDDATTSCTDRENGDREGNVCLCHWAPWFEGLLDLDARTGRPRNFTDPYDAPILGDPFADIPAAEPWRPRRSR